MNELLLEWKELLKLYDWEITLSDNEYTLPGPGCCGYTEWSEAGKSAHIYLLNEEAYGDRVVKYDKEKTLVHELLHLKFSLLDQPENTLQSRVLHQLIDDTAKALVSAKRHSIKNCCE
ncbi:MAG: hypothetical protein IJ719_11710 [Clostridia bacterium]|nr:hypothetical protein [Clostridia bacterium]